MSPSLIGLFLFGYLAVIVAMFGMLRIVKLSLLTPSIPMLFIISYLLFSYLGTPMLVLGWDRNAVFYRATDDAISLAVWAYSGASLLILCAGFVLAQFAIPRKTHESRSRDQQKLREFGLNLPIVIGLIAVSAVSLWYYFQIIQTVALVELIQGQDQSTLAAARSDATNALAHAWRYRLFPGYVVPFLSYVLFAAYLIQRRSTYACLFVVCAAFASFYCVMNLMRGPLLFYWGSLVFLYFLVRGEKITLRSAAVFIMISAVFLISIVLAITRTEAGSAVEGIVNRTLSGGQFAAYHYLLIFPERHEFLYGATLPNPAGLLPGEVFPLTVYVSEYIYGPSTRIVGSAPAAFWSELYANFGTPGVIIGSFAFGIMLWILHQWVGSLRKTPINLALIVVIAFYVRNISTSGLLAYIVPVELAFICVVAVLLRMRFGILTHRHRASTATATTYRSRQ